MNTDSCYKQLHHVFKECLYIPYCSASTYYLVDGITPPKKFGTDCVGQVQYLNERLKKLGIKSAYIEDNIVGRHRSLICNLDETIYYMSPYLMHLEPIRLVQGAQSVYVLPFNKKPSHLYIKLAVNELVVRKIWSWQNRKDYFLFDLCSTTNNNLTLNEWVARLLHAEQKTLSLRIVDSENSEVLHYVVSTINPRTRYCISSFGISKCESNKYNNVLRRMALCLQTSPAEIIDFIDYAYTIRTSVLNKHVKSCCGGHGSLDSHREGISYRPGTKKNELFG